MQNDTEIILRFEMGCTPAEFRQRLPALADVEYNPEQTQFDHVEVGRRWSVRLSDPRDRVIGSLRVPTVYVEFVFQRYGLPTSTPVWRAFTLTSAVAAADQVGGNRAIASDCAGPKA